MVLAYSLISGQKLLPKVIAAPLACYCLAGNFAPLHRVEWLGLMLCGFGLLTLMPAGSRVVTAIKGMLVLGLLFITILVGFGGIASKARHTQGFFQVLPAEPHSVTASNRATVIKGD